MSGQWTPGPWVEGKSRDWSANINVLDAQGKRVATMAITRNASGELQQEGYANARLIAAAPELLEALSAIMNAHASNVLFHNSALAERAHDAIAKAKGTAS